MYIYIYTMYTYICILYIYIHIRIYIPTLGSTGNHPYDNPYWFPDIPNPSTEYILLIMEYHIISQQTVKMYIKNMIHHQRSTVSF